MRTIKELQQDFNEHREVRQLLRDDNYKFN